MGFIKQESLKGQKNSESCIYKHEETGLELLHVCCDDQEKLFAYIVPTVPLNDKGLPHIIEHTVLCGSKNYPEKDPFKILLEKSSNTFINAMTYPDRTLYPASSLYEKDFWTLFDVYTDAVFFPLLKKQAFQQEAYHFSMQEKQLNLSGIVYSEMKGAYSNNQGIINQACYQSLFPSGPYHYDSGGNPEAIIKLSYSEFLKYYHQFYHPSYIKLFVYGRLDINPILQHLQENVLCHYQKAQWSNPQVEPSQIIKKPFYQSLPYYPQNQEFSDSLFFNYIVGDVCQAYEHFLSCLLQNILLDDSSPIIRNLLNEQWAESISDLSGLETDLHWSVFTLGLNHIDREKIEATKKYVEKQWKNLIIQGLDKDLVQGIVFQWECAYKEPKALGKGFKILNRIAGPWRYGYNPLLYIDLGQHLEKVKQQLNRGEKPLEQLMEKIFLDNPQQSVLHFYVDEKLEENQWQREQKLLKDKQKLLTKDTIEEIDQDMESLKQFQDQQEQGIFSKQAFSQLQDLSVHPLFEWTEKKDYSINSIHYYKQAALGQLCFAYVGFTIKDMPEEWIYYLPVLQELMDCIGTEQYHYSDLSIQLNKNIYGWRFLVSLIQQEQTGQLKDAYFGLFYKTNMSKFSSTLQLIQQMFNQLDWCNEQRIKQVIIQWYQQLQDNIDRHPLGPLMINSTSKNVSLRQENTIQQWKEKIQGFQLYFFWKKKISQLSEQLPHIIQQCQQILQTMVSAKQAIHCVSSEYSNIQSMMDQIKQHWQQSQLNLSWDSFDLSPSFYSQGDFFIKPTKVSNIVCSFARREENSFVHKAYYQIIAHLLETKILWKTVRMENGSYGVGAKAPFFGKGFYLYSAEDPNIVFTLKAFQNSFQQLLQQCQREDVDQAAFVLLAEELNPISPMQKMQIAFNRYLSGLQEQEYYKYIHAYKNIDFNLLKELIDQLSKDYDQYCQWSIMSSKTLIDTQRVPVNFEAHKYEL